MRHRSNQKVSESEWVGTFLLIFWTSYAPFMAKYGFDLFFTIIDLYYLFGNRQDMSKW